MIFEHLENNLSLKHLWSTEARLYGEREREGERYKWWKEREREGERYKWWKERERGSIFQSEREWIRKAKNVSVWWIAP